MHDIAVIGAGPAGSTLARLIGKKYRVLLVDRQGSHDASGNPRTAKCCGGLLAPDAQKMLSTLGLGLPKTVLEDPQLFVVKAIDLQQGMERDYQRHYINMNRGKFDAWLLSLVPEEVDVRSGCRLKSLARDGAGWKLSLVERGKTCTEIAHVVVGADGARSAVRRQCFSDRPMPREYFAIQEWVEGDHDLPYFTSIFDREITDYYCWTIPKDGRLIVGAAIHPKREAARRFDRLKEKLKRHGFRFGRTLHREGALVLRPRSVGQICTTAPGAALVGEAAGWISPSSAEGLSYALGSAMQLAEALQTTLDGFEYRYDRATRALRRNICFKNLKSPFIFNPLLRKAVMRTGLQSMRIHESVGVGQAPPDSETLDVA